MANLKFIKGTDNSEHGPSSKAEGQVIFAVSSDKSSGDIYLDVDSNTRIKMSANADHADLASTAETLTTTEAGSTTNPVYFTGGKPVAVPYSFSEANIGDSSTDQLIPTSLSVKKSLPKTFTWINGTTLGPTATLTSESGLIVNFGAIPAASSSTSGILTTGPQTIKGIKTFSDNILGNLTGNADTATKLQTQRTINGTNFDGSTNITTANWGAARNLTIGNSTKSVNGSENISWSLSEMGAASLATATQNSNGLMSSSDKTKLDGIETEANKYIHPSTHSANMITFDDGDSFQDKYNNGELKGQDGNNGLTPIFSIENGHLFVEYISESELVATAEIVTKVINSGVFLQ